MQITGLTPNIMVEDVNQTVEFFQTLLGFTLVNSEPESGQLIWAMLQHGETRLMFQSRNSLGEDIPRFKNLPTGGTLNFYTNVDDVKAWYEKLKGKVEIVQDLQTTFYGATEFSFVDCNGYIFTFAQGV
jgi:uncharacterized glyoxalase superfamily protein PhnB